MNSTRAARIAFGGLLLFLTSLGAGGCRWASGAGDTVETPPRALVEKTFKPGGAPPTQKADPAAAAATTGTTK